MPSEVLGQGSYGCIHKPSLTCKEKKNKSFYEGRVSKLMLSTHAKKEMAEYVVVKKADPKNEYYPGSPTICEMNYTVEKKGTELLSEEDLESAKKCKLFVHNPSKYKLLIIPDGGMDLDKYGTILKKTPSTLKTEESFEKFWIEVHRLFMGVSVFIKHNLVHHDLKPQNIVYNEETNRLNFIDFGLMQKMRFDSANDMRERWFNYPPEVIYYYAPSYDNLVRMSDEAICKTVVAEFKQPHNSRHLQAFLRYALGDKMSKDEYINEQAVKEYIRGCFKTVLALKTHMKSKEGWSALVQRSQKTFDIYGLGMSLKYMMHCGKHLLDEATFEMLFEITDQMTETNLHKRPYIDSLIDMYEEFLKDSGLLHKHGKKIVNHKIVNGDDFPIIENATVKSILDKNPVSHREIKQIAQQTPRDCPSDKELNPKTHKCVLKCKEGFERSSDTFRCIKSKTQKTCPEGKELNPKTNKCIKSKSKTQKTCPEGKELNPKTNKCIKSKSKTQKTCPEGKELNPKTNKSKSKTQKKCPEGKKLNPDTNRCVKSQKTCPEGKKLNPDTNRCVKIPQQ
jgi:serine/threonine protein kinase